MFNILAQIRIALKPGSEIGDLVISLIQDEFIPKMDALIAEAKNREEDTSKLEETRSLWVQYSDKNSAESRKWRDIAFQRLYSVSKKFPKFEHEIDEVESKIVEQFLSERRFRTGLNKVDVLGGPDDLARNLQGIIYKAAMNVFRNLMRASPEWGLKTKEGPGNRLKDVQEEGRDEHMSILDQLESPAVTTNLDLDSMKKQLGRLDRAFRSKYGHNVVMMAVYEAWMQLARDKGAENINFKRDIEIPLLEKFEKEGIKGNRAYISQMKQEMLRFFVGFFKEEGGAEEEEYTARFRGGSLKIAESLAEEDFRRKTASWVLELYRFATR